MSIYIAGDCGLFGTSLKKQLSQSDVITATHKELDLTMQKDVLSFFEKNKPEYVYIAAAKVGGIIANKTYPADFLYENMMINFNIINAAHITGVKKLLYLGTSCMYPKYCKMPIKEEYLLTGKVEPTNEGYAIAKIAGLKLCEFYNAQYNNNFICAVPANVYGIGDCLDENKNHVIPSLIKKIYTAKQLGEKEVQVWGSGNAKREFLYIDDAVSACIMLMREYKKNEAINIGTGVSTSIKELIEIIVEVAEYKGDIIFDTSKPDGMEERLLDSSKIMKLGYKPKVCLKEGIKKTYEWYKSLEKGK